MIFGKDGDFGGKIGDFGVENGEIGVKSGNLGVKMGFWESKYPKLRSQNSPKATKRLKSDPKNEPFIGRKPRGFWGEIVGFGGRNIYIVFFLGGKPQNWGFWERNGEFGLEK